MPAKFAYPLKRSPKSDPQQYRVYRMENEAIGARRYMSMDRETAQQLARSVCRNYRVPRVELRWADLGRWAAEWVPASNKRGECIVLSTRKRNARDILTLTHELAHHVHHHLSDGADTTHEDHGPEFMACHISILDTCRVVPVVGMRAVCDAWEIRYVDPGVGSSLTVLQRIVRKHGRNRPTG